MERLLGAATTHRLWIKNLTVPVATATFRHSNHVTIKRAASTPSGERFWTLASEAPASSPTQLSILCELIRKVILPPPASLTAPPAAVWLCKLASPSFASGKD